MAELLVAYRRDRVPEEGKFWVEGVWAVNDLIGELMSACPGTPLDDELADSDRREAWAKDRIAFWDLQDLPSLGGWEWRGLYKAWRVALSMNLVSPEADLLLSRENACRHPQIGG